MHSDSAVFRPPYASIYLHCFNCTSFTTIFWVEPTQLPCAASPTFQLSPTLECVPLIQSCVFLFLSGLDIAQHVTLSMCSHVLWPTDVTHGVVCPHLAIIRIFSRMGKLCAVANCGNSNWTCHALHEFPSDPALKEVWVQFVQAKRVNFKPPTKKNQACLCEEHFTPDCYTVRSKYMTEFGLPFRKSLIQGSVPTIQAREDPISSTPCSENKQPSLLIKPDILHKNETETVIQILYDLLLEPGTCCVEIGSLKPVVLGGRWEIQYNLS